VGIGEKRGGIRIGMRIAAPVANALNAASDEKWNGEPR